MDAPCRATMHAYRQPLASDPANYIYCVCAITSPLGHTAQLSRSKCAASTQLLSYSWMTNGIPSSGRLRLPAQATRSLDSVGGSWWQQGEHACIGSQMLNLSAAFFDVLNPTGNLLVFVQWCACIESVVRIVTLFTCL